MFYHRLDPQEMERAEQFRNERAAMLRKYQGRDLANVAAIPLAAWNAHFRFLAEYLAAKRFPVKG